MNNNSNQFTIALAGNPNCGKTSVFNILTNSNYKVANYPGVTVERKIGLLSRICDNEKITVIDLPGIYSLSSTSLDEKIATETLINDKYPPRPDLLIAVIDASNLERNLYLLSQLIDTGIPVVVALNMIDIAKKRGIKVYSELLSKKLNLPVVCINAKTGSGINELVSLIIEKKFPQTLNGNLFNWCDNKVFLKAANDLGKNIRPDATYSNQTLIGLSLLSENTSNELYSSPLTKPTQVNLAAQNIDYLSLEATLRYKWANSIILESVTQTNTSFSNRIKILDNYLTHPIWGGVIFVLIMASMFQAIFSWAQAPMEFIEFIIGTVSDFSSSLLNDGVIKSLIIDGIIAGVGSVLIFIPQIALLFLFLGILEDSGYLSRAAFLMDGLMRKVGLQGRSFIPLLSSFACAIPGIMSTRTIPSWSDRLTTILVAPLMSCSARLPVYTVIIAALIPNQKVLGIFSLQAITMLSLYLLGIFGAAAVSWILKKTFLSREPAFFIMELPPLRRPSFRLIFREIWDRVKLFCKSAGTVILACSLILWFVLSYPRTSNNESPKLVDSYAGTIGTSIEPILKPIGLNWEMGIGIVASFAAREVFVSALATIYNLSDDDESEGYKSLISILEEKGKNNEITLPSTLSLLVFYVFACQCISTLAITKRETGGWKWPFVMFTYMTLLAYVASYMTYHLGNKFFVN